VTGQDGGTPAAGAVTVAYVHGNEVTYSWHHSMVEMVGYDMAKEGRIIRGGYIAMRYGASGLVEARNKTAAEFLASADADWLLWLDTDMGFPADLADRLIGAADPAERPVVGALAFAQKETAPDGMGGWRCTAAPTIFDWARMPDGREGFTTRWDYPPDTLVRCAGTGSACILIHKSVFAKIAARYGPVWYDMAPNPTTRELIGEDLSFCARAGALGVPVYVHTGVQCTHMKPVWLAEGDYFRERLADPAPLLRGAAEGMLGGKPVRLSVSWPEGTPDGMTPGELAAVADQMDAERGKVTLAGAEAEPAGSPA
jgi:hypothetical protein